MMAVELAAARRTTAAGRQRGLAYGHHSGATRAAKAVTMRAADGAAAMVAEVTAAAHRR